MNQRPQPALPWLGALHARMRLLLAALLVALPLAGAQAQKAAPPQEGVDVGKSSRLAGLVPAADVERAAVQQYNQLLQQAQSKHALAPAGHPQLLRLQTISKRLIPHAIPWNERARNWRWEVNLIGSQSINAFCMPGGKIAVFVGILERLELTDDEVAMVVGHEMAHALREHARERLGKNAVTQGAARIGGAVLSSIFGIDPNLTDLVARGGASMLSLKFGRDDESEADLVGMEIAARAGYDPRAAITLWRKMAKAQAGKGAPPEWLSTHPSGASRIAELEKNLPRVMPLYERTLAAKR
ncbi:MAG TPA: M48 family metallopeptidase [Ramlibacter sp.]|nr:M48 family metallopeptidase [Ramlibacter sp.]